MTMMIMMMMIIMTMMIIMILIMVILVIRVFAVQCIGSVSMGISSIRRRTTTTLYFVYNCCRIKLRVEMLQSGHTLQQLMFPRNLILRNCQLSPIFRESLLLLAFQNQDTDSENNINVYPTVCSTLQITLYSVLYSNNIHL